MAVDDDAAILQDQDLRHSRLDLQPVGRDLDVAFQPLGFLPQNMHELGQPGDFLLERRQLHVLGDRRDGGADGARADALCRLGQQARETQMALSSCAADLLERVIDSETPRECRLKWQPLTGRPTHLVREVLSELWKRQNWPRQRMTFEHWDRLAGLLLAGGSADFPDGVRASRTGRTLTITHNLEAT